MSKDKQFTPLEALVHLQPLFPWAKHIYKTDPFGEWVISENIPIHRTGLYCPYYANNGKIAGIEDINIKYDGDWKDSYFTTAKEGE